MKAEQLILLSWKQARNLNLTADKKQAHKARRIQAEMRLHVACKRFEKVVKRLEKGI